ncbi:MAG: hypothetical protein ACM3Q2_05030 [Syntrophothermus sp.]
MRKKRNTEYSTTWKLINILGQDRLFEIWQLRGHLATARYLTEELDMDVTYGIVLHLVRKFKWVRTITNKNLPLYRGVLSGKLNPADYKSVKFE